MALISNRPLEPRALPPLQIALQPVVEISSGTPVGYEALSRFVDGDPEAVFAQAHRDGRGPELEAAAIQAAIPQRPAGSYLSVNVSVGALVSEQVRAVLPADLTGVVLEITEQTDTDDWDEVMAVVGDCRARGALVAIDDWGRGYSNVERIMRLRPEVVKLDRSLLGDLEDAGRQESLRTLVGWARSMGARVCAEGVETSEQWRLLREVGVDLGQGYYFGRPTSACHRADDRPGPRDDPPLTHRPVRPSMQSRSRSACPMWRAYSSIMWTRTSRMLTTSSWWATSRPRSDSSTPSSQASADATSLVPMAQHQQPAPRRDEPQVKYRSQ